VLRYKLRTLLMLLLVAPPALAGVAWLMGYGRGGPVTVVVSIYACLATVLVVISTLLERIAPFRPRGICSYCGLARRPMAEGMDNALICRECAEKCIAIIDEETARQNHAESRPKADPGFKSSQPVDRLPERVTRSR
jgi:hypothetical protein